MKTGMRFSSDFSAMLYLAKILMDELHRDRALAHSGGHSLNGPVTNISHSKQPGNVRLQQEGIALQRPPLRSSAIPQKVRSSQNKSAFGALDAVSQPIRARQRANKNEHGVGWNTLDFVGVRTEN